jgi:hypothetical protein
MNNVQNCDNYACTIREGTTCPGKTLFQRYTSILQSGGLEISDKNAYRPPQHSHRLTGLQVYWSRGNEFSARFRWANFVLFGCRAQLTSNSLCWQFSNGSISWRKQTAMRLTPHFLSTLSPPPLRLPQEWYHPFRRCKQNFVSSHTTRGHAVA